MDIRRAFVTEKVVSGNLFKNENPSFPSKTYGSFSLTRLDNSPSESGMISGQISESSHFSNIDNPREGSVGNLPNQKSPLKIYSARPSQNTDVYHVSSIRHQNVTIQKKNKWVEKKKHSKVVENPEMGNTFIPLSVRLEEAEHTQTLETVTYPSRALRACITNSLGS